MGSDSNLTASRCEENRRKVRAPSLFLTGGPEEMKGGLSRANVAANSRKQPVQGGIVSVRRTGGGTVI